MNNILVHIGYHKTGTTWMQNELFGSISDVFIPLSQNKNRPSTLAKSFIFDKEGYLLNSFDANEKTIREDLGELPGSKNYNEDKILVMSHERLSGNPHSSGFDSSLIAGRIANIFPNAKILIIIREQSSWILSNYFQYLSIGGTHSLKEYLNIKYDGKRPGFSPSHIEYHHLIQDYRARFGKQKVLVLPYELLHLDSTFFIKHIEAFIEKKISMDHIDFDKRYNIKNDHYINYKLRSLNRYIHSSSVNNYSSLNNKVSKFLAMSLVKLLSKFLPKSINKSFKKKLKKEIIEWSQDRFANSNRIIQDIMEIDLERFGYKKNNKGDVLKLNTFG